MPRPGKRPAPPPVPEHMCVQCLKRPAYPHNGGLCEVCAPPLKAPKTRAAMAARREFWRSWPAPRLALGAVVYPAAYGPPDVA